MKEAELRSRAGIFSAFAESPHTGSPTKPPTLFVGFGFLFPRASTLAVALLALTFAWGVEFSQLYHAPWIDVVRATIPGRLVLGTTFSWPDLPAYAVGIALGAFAEWRWRKTARV